MNSQHEGDAQNDGQDRGHDVVAHGQPANLAHLFHVELTEIGDQGDGDEWNNGRLEHVHHDLAREANVHLGCIRELDVAQRQPNGDAQQHGCDRGEQQGIRLEPARDLNTICWETGRITFRLLETSSRSDEGEDEEDFLETAVLVDIVMTTVGLEAESVLNPFRES